jgi:hypothetical protein
MLNDTDLTPDELQKLTNIAAKRFFEWNSGKNTPNILINLSNNIEALGKSLDLNSAIITQKSNL